MQDDENIHALQPDNDENTSKNVNEPSSEIPEPTTPSPAVNITDKKFEKMEVHHGSHGHGKKKWTDYIFEFFMLFLAVFCGFFAEYKLEGVVEHKKEREYMKSMLEDLKEDTAKISQSLTYNYWLLSGLDSLVKIVYQYKKNDSLTVKNMYLWYIAYGRNNYTVHFTDRTISQMKSSGGFRSLPQAISDSILRYEEGANMAMNQEVTYKDRWQKAVDLSTDIFDYRYISYSVNAFDKNYYQYLPQSRYQLLSDDASLLTKYCSLLELWKQTVVVYINHLQAIKYRAIFLIPYLKEEYHFK